MSASSTATAAGPSPKIVSISWGQIEIAVSSSSSSSANTHKLKDAKLYPGGSREWDWSETGTRHQPGIQVADTEEILKQGVTDIVLSRGMDLKLKVSPDTVTQLERRGVKVHVAETKEAVSIYNGLVEEGRKVGGLFHSTC